MSRQLHHRSSVELVDFLVGAHSEVLVDLCKILGDRMGFNDLRSRYCASDRIPNEPALRRALATELAVELEYFSANNLAYWSRVLTSENRGVGYHEALHDVCKALNKQLNKKIQIPRVASVAERESMVCSQLLGIAFQGKTEVEIARMLAEAELEVDAKKARAIHAAIVDGGGALLIGLVKLLGKRTVTSLTFSTLKWIITKKLGREAAEKLIFAVAKKTTQKAVSTFASGIGLALIAWDLVSLAGPATRVTIPAVALIATVRCAGRLDAEA